MSILIRKLSVSSRKQLPRRSILHLNSIVGQTERESVDAHGSE